MVRCVRLEVRHTCVRFGIDARTMLVRQIDLELRFRDLGRERKQLNKKAFTCMIEYDST